MDRKKWAASRLATIVTILVSIWIELHRRGYERERATSEGRAGGSIGRSDRPRRSDLSWETDRLGFEVRR